MAEIAQPPAAAARVEPRQDAADRTEPNRVAGAAGVDAALSFSWDGRALTGRTGDSLASALLANGVRVVGRSFKYHRPRGVTSAGVEETGAIVTTGAGDRRIANVNAATCELTDGLAAFGQNAWPSVRRDVGAITQMGGAGFAAGFYYKTFFSASPFGGRGTRHWMWFETLIRRAAGMGRVSRSADPDDYEHAHLHCDDLVVGSGPAGLAAASALSAAGRDVVLVEQDFELGGRLLSDQSQVEGAAPDAWRRTRLEAIHAAGGRVMTRTMAFGLYDHGVAGLVERVVDQGPRERIWIARAERIVLATGAIERGLAFADNDRPGVMTAGALRTYFNRHGVAPGRRIAIVASDDGAYDSIPAMRRAGVDVSVLDLRAEAPSSSDGVRVLAGAAPLRAIGAKGVKAIEIARRGDGAWRAEPGRIDVDLVATSGGWRPSLHLLAHRGVRLVWDPSRGAHVAPDGFDETPTAQGIVLCGAAAGLESSDACAESGRAVADRILGRDAVWPASENRARATEMIIQAPGHRRGKAFVDLANDVTVKDLKLAAQEGYVSPEHAKRYTTLGMAIDQGKASGDLGLAALAEARGEALDSLSPTTARPPYAPVSIGALAGPRKGALYKPTRRTPLHEWHRRNGAVFTDAGIWKRAWYYPRAGETLDDAYIREADTVRKTVGIADVSTLGKIALSGPDAAEFLERTFVNNFAKLPIGKARYGVMLRDDGLVFDDGTVWRLGPSDYLVTTTTAHAGPAMKRLEMLHQTRWPELSVAMYSVSDAFASLAVAGPDARRVVAAALPSLDVSDAALPFMGVVETPFEGRKAFVARLSFSGELAYEVYAPAELGEALAEALWRVAEPIGGVLYGLEALGALRIEKGHVAGAEIDGRTTLADLGLDGMASKKKAYVGQALAKRDALIDPERPRLVGLEPTDPAAPIQAGAILCARGSVGGHGVGWVSSTTYAPALGRRIALGFIAGGVDAWAGRKVVAADPVRGHEIDVDVVWPHFVDPAGDRVRVSVADDGPQLDPPGGLPGPVSALGSVAGAQARIGEPNEAVWIREAAPERQLWLAASTRSAGESVLATLGGSAPDLGRWLSFGDGVRVLRTGPLEWRIAGLGGEAADRLRAAAVQSPGILGCWPIGSGWSTFEIRGSDALDLAARLVSVDLRPRSAPIGWCGAVGVLGAPALLARVDDGLDLYAMRSYAADVWGELERLAERRKAVVDR